jgi:glucose-1-phosphate cytidylyltransferase
MAARFGNDRTRAMKVVLFCGGLGLRIRDAGEQVPKPMVTLGYRPLIWHVMKYYAHYGYRDFILCLGYRGDAIKQYFLNYNEALSNNFVLSEGGKNLQLMNSDIHDWRITFMDTGSTSNIGQRLKAVEPLLRDESVFMANYTDGLTDLSLPQHLDHFHRHGAVASFVTVKPNLSYHTVTVGEDGRVSAIQELRHTALRINAGYFIFRREIFDYIQPGEELVVEPFQRLVQCGRLLAYQHDGFFMAMDTFKDRQILEDILARGHAPWEVWNGVATRDA